MKTTEEKGFQVNGFKAWGIAGGIKKNGRKDIALIVSDRDAVAAGVFTTNSVKAAPVLLDQKVVARGSARAIVANSGCANACTGAQGLDDAARTAETTAKQLGIDAKDVLVSSTGVIGELLPMRKLESGISMASGLLSSTGWEQAAEAIMTTDLRPKLATAQDTIGGKTVTVAGIAKGSGMIHPNMATMLCFVVTDAAISPAMLKKSLAAANERSFNAITVDGDTSTNDMVLCLANGAAGNKKISAGGADQKRFEACLESVLRSLAKQVVRDGEGATKLVEVTVMNAKNPVEAKQAAMTVAKSSLVKTALFGADANWGRIMAALGYSGVSMNEQMTDISIGKTKLVEKGVSLGKTADRQATAALKERNVVITIDLRKGKSAATVWTCDLSYDYVKINAAYRS